MTIRTDRFIGHSYLRDGGGRARTVASDRIFRRHSGGKVRTVSAHPIGRVQTLREIYTPGAAQVCEAIANDQSLAARYTAAGSTVAVITNGSAVRGLGSIGPVAALPVVEGKAALLDQLADLSGVPIALDCRDADRLVDVISAMSPSFGAIMLEEIESPVCCAVERELGERLRLPVFHDDQHGTGVVVLATLIAAAARYGMRLADCSVGVVGLGPAGTAVARLLASAGCSRLLGHDRDAKALERLDELGGQSAAVDELMGCADIVVAATGQAGSIDPSMIRGGQVVLALSNSEPEIEPRAALAAGARFAANGASINSLLCFPGLLRGALEVRAERIGDSMLLAAAEALGTWMTAHGLQPDPLNRSLHHRVSEAVRMAARAI